MASEANKFVEVSVEAKRRLAKLLATENLTIEHRNVSTAMFDVKNRVLVLPNWKGMSKDLYDTFTIHEVGHALFTEVDDVVDTIKDKNFKNPDAEAAYKSFVNIVEDARIEKKMKRKFPGGVAGFKRGYEELVERDFFGTKSRSIGSYSFIDRLNIHTKLGDSAKVPFFDVDELNLLKKVESCETWDDVIEAVDAIWEHEGCKDSATDRHESFSAGDGDFEESDGEPDDSEGSSPFNDDAEGNAEKNGKKAPKGKNKKPEDDADNEEKNNAGGSTDGAGDEDGDDGAGGADGDEDGDDGAGGADGDEDGADGDEDGAGGDEDGADGDEDGAGGDEDGDGNKNGSGREGSEDGAEREWSPPAASETDSAFRDRSEALIDRNGIEFDHVEVPCDDAFNLKNIIVSPDHISEAFNKEISALDGFSGTREGVRKALTKYIRDNRKVINYLVKEFEMRKAADESSRALTSKTGVLDTNKIHSYKWNDDVFKRITNIPEGKSHGLVMFLDWSGSMGGNIVGSIDQILNLISFCKRVGIPYDVYAFTNSWYNRSYYNSRTYQESTSTNRPGLGSKLNKDKLKKYDITFDDSFNLLHFATSSTKNRKTASEHLENLFMIRELYARSRYGTTAIPTSIKIPTISGISLGGTPLHQAIMTAIPIVNKFREKHRLQIVNTVFLTDGAGSGLNTLHGVPHNTNRWNVHERNSRQEWVQAINWYQSANDDSNTYPQMRILLDILRARTGTKIVNFYITLNIKSAFLREWADASGLGVDGEYDSESLSHWNRKKWSFTDRSKEAWKTAVAENGIAVEDCPLGWDSIYLILGSKNLESSSEEDHRVGDLEGMKKGAMTRAFIDASKNKLKTRIILRKFAEMIAA